jgi:hypothetical protein
VAIVGEKREGQLVPLAIRNDTTGYERIAEVSYSYGFAIAMIVLGVVLFALITGIFMIAWGLCLIFKINRDKKVIAEAKRRLHGIPRALQRRLLSARPGTQFARYSLSKPAMPSIPSGTKHVHCSVS